MCLKLDWLFILIDFSLLVLMNLVVGLYDVDFLGYVPVNHCSL